MLYAAPGAGTSWRRGRDLSVIRPSECRCLAFQERSENGGGWIGVQGTGSNRRERLQLTVGPDQTGKAGRDAFDFSYSHSFLSASHQGVLLHRKRRNR